MFKDRLVSLGIAGVFDPPFAQRRVVGLLVSLGAEADIGLAVFHILAQGIGTQRVLQHHRAGITVQTGSPQPGSTVGQRHLIEFFDHRLRLGCPPTDRSAHAGHDRDLREVLGDVNQVRLGRLQIPFAPLYRAFQRLIEQLSGHHPHHHLAEYRHEHRGDVQPKHADLQQVCELGVTRLGIHLSGGYRVGAGVGDQLFAVLLIEILPGVDVRRPDTLAGSGTCRRRQIGVVVGFQFGRRLGWQLLDARDELRRGEVQEFLPWRTPDVRRGVGGLLGELAEVVSPLCIGHEPTEERLVRRRRRVGALGGVALGKQTLELFFHLRPGIALERMHRVLGNVNDQLIGVGVFLADQEHHAAGHPELHQAQGPEPHLLVAHPRVNFALDHREDHALVGGLDIPGQHRLLGGGLQCSLLAGNEVLTQGDLCGALLRVKKRLQIRLVFGADVQAAAQAEELADLEVERHRMVGAGGAGRLHEPRGLVVRPFLALISFEVVQGRLQHRQLQELEVRHLDFENSHRQRSAQAQQGFIDVHLHLVLVLQRLEQQGPGEGVDVLEAGHGFVQLGLCGKARQEAGRQRFALHGRGFFKPGRLRRGCGLERLLACRCGLDQPGGAGAFEEVAMQALRCGRRGRLGYIGHRVTPLKWSASTPRWLWRQAVHMWRSATQAPSAVSLYRQCDDEIRFAMAGRPVAPRQPSSDSTRQRISSCPTPLHPPQPPSSNCLPKRSTPVSPRARPCIRWCSMHCVGAFWNSTRH